VVELDATLLVLTVTAMLVSLPSPKGQVLDGVRTPRYHWLRSP
jgi:hypothetical protein